MNHLKVLELRSAEHIVKLSYVREVRSVGDVHQSSLANTPSIIRGWLSDHKRVELVGCNGKTNVYSLHYDGQGCN